MSASWPKSQSAALQEDEYEWFKGFADFRHLLLPHLRPTDKVLVLGCGNSSLPLDLWKEGYRNITSIDLSPAVIAKMEARSQALVRLHLLLPPTCTSDSTVVLRSAILTAPRIVVVARGLQGCHKHCLLPANPAKMEARSQALMSSHSLTVHVCSSAADTSVGVGPL